MFVAKPAVLAFTRAAGSLSGTDGVALARHCVAALRPRASTDSDNLQNIHCDAVRAPRCIPVVVQRDVDVRAQDFEFRVRLAAALKADGMYKDAAHTLAAYKKYEAVLLTK